jgi:hypothetical protein
MFSRLNDELDSIIIPNVMIVNNGKWNIVAIARLQRVLHRVEYGQVGRLMLIGMEGFLVYYLFLPVIH